MGAGMLNALTIDVEEWFSVSNFEKVIRREDWDSLESRVEMQTDKLLALLARRDVKATFFILGWVAERHPALIRRIADAGHEIALVGIWTSAGRQQEQIADRKNYSHAGTSPLEPGRIAPTL